MKVHVPVNLLQNIFDVCYKVSVFKEQFFPNQQIKTLCIQSHWYAYFTSAAMKEVVILREIYYFF